MLEQEQVDLQHQQSAAKGGVKRKRGDKEPQGGYPPKSARWRESGYCGKIIRKPPGAPVGTPKLQTDVTDQDRVRGVAQRKDQPPDPTVMNQCEGGGA